MLGMARAKFTTETSYDTIDDILSYQGGSSDIAEKQKRSLITNPDKDIKLEPYGCFSNLEEKFFYKKMNPYSKLKIFDSGIILNENIDYVDLLEQVKSNGFVDYSNKIIKKYPDLTKISLQEISALALLAGYSYISIYKNNPTEHGKVYLTYSPPMNKHNIYGWFNDKEYKKNLTSPDLPNHSLTRGSGDTCGYPCNGNDNYMCGSIVYPNIKTPPQFAVYRIIETI